MYSPAERPSRRRAAPAKKRRLSAQTGISSRADGSGLPTFRDSSSASSSACSSIRSASRSKIWARSPGVVSSHSGSASTAASTARSTSACVPSGTSPIISPVAGFTISATPPSTASTQRPPTVGLEKAQQPVCQGGVHDADRRFSPDEAGHVGEGRSGGDLPGGFDSVCQRQDARDRLHPAGQRFQWDVDAAEEQQQQSDEVRQEEDVTRAEADGAGHQAERGAGKGADDDDERDSRDLRGAKVEVE